MIKYLLGIVLTLFTYSCYCCDCKEPENVETELANSDIVISVKVIEILDRGENHFNGVTIARAGYKVKVQVLTTFKGKDDLKYLTIRGIGNTCDYYFQKEMKYIVYGQLVEGDLVTSSCHRTAELKGNTDLQELKKIKKTNHNNH